MTFFRLTVLCLHPRRFAAYLQSYYCISSLMPMAYATRRTPRSHTGTARTQQARHPNGSRTIHPQVRSRRRTSPSWSAHSSTGECSSLSIPDIPSYTRTLITSQTILQAGIHPFSRPVGIPTIRAHSASISISHTIIIHPEIVTIHPHSARTHSTQYFIRQTWTDLLTHSSLMRHHH